MNNKLPYSIYILVEFCNLVILGLDLFYNSKELLVDIVGEFCDEIGKKDITLICGGEGPLT